MPERPGPYRGHGVPREVITHAVRLSLWFALSYRDVEELLAERGVVVSYETVRTPGSGNASDRRPDLTRSPTRCGMAAPHSANVQAVQGLIVDEAVAYVVGE